MEGGRRVVGACRRVGSHRRGLSLVAVPWGGAEEPEAALEVWAEDRGGRAARTESKATAGAK